jgi:hypothetical protein
MRGNSMDDPRNQPLPQNAIMSERARIFAQDLAFGCDVQDWIEEFVAVAGFWYFDNLVENHDKMGDKLKEYIHSKWSNNPPSPESLVSFGFLSQSWNKTNMYHLTKVAFQLNKAQSPTLIFISYRGSESSAFALLVEARLKLAGVKKVFIDKNMPGGGKWKDDLEKNVKECQYFICLMGPTTLESTNVKQEIEWAILNEKKLIPVCHNGYRLKEAIQVFPSLENSNGREIKASPQDVTAREYDEIVQFVVNSVVSEVSS